MGRKLGDYYYNEAKMEQQFAKEREKGAGIVGFAAGAIVGLIVGGLMGKGDIELNKYIDDIKGNSQIESEFDTEEMGM